MNKFWLYLIILGIAAGGIAGARWYWIDEGKSRYENAVAVQTQEKVVENDKQLRPIRSYRPSVDRVAGRLRAGTF